MKKLFSKEGKEESLSSVVGEMGTSQNSMGEQGNVVWRTMKFCPGVG